MPLVFRQDYRIPVNSALTGNDRDCRISDYRRFGFPVFKKAVSWLAGDSRLRQTLSLRIYLVEQRSYCPSSFIFILERSLKPPLGPALAGLSPVSIELSKQEKTCYTLLPFSLQ